MKRRERRSSCSSDRHFSFLGKGTSMLEIILLVWLCRKIGAIAREKGRKAVGYQFMLVGMWLGGEIGGMVAGVLMVGANPGGGINPTAYLFALMGAAAGAIVTFVIVNSLSDKMLGSPQRGFAVNPGGPYQPPPPQY